MYTWTLKRLLCYLHALYVQYMCRRVCAQSCLTLCDPMDCSPPDSSVHGISQARILEWVAIPPPGNLLDPGIEPVSLASPAWAGRFFTTRGTAYTHTHTHTHTHVCCCLVIKSCSTLCDFIHYCLPGSPVLHCLLEFAQIHFHWLVMLSNHLIPCCGPYFRLQSFPASGSFPMSWLSASCGQNFRASASASVLPVNSQGWFPLGWTGLISLQSKGLSRVFSSTTVQKHKVFGVQLSL